MTTNQKIETSREIRQWISTATGLIIGLAYGAVMLSAGWDSIKDTCGEIKEGIHNKIENWKEKREERKTR